MKDWIMLVLAVDPRLDSLTETIDARVETLAATPVLGTMSQIERIMELNDKKIKLINLRVMHDRMCAALSSAEYELIFYYAMGFSVAKLAARRQRSPAYIYRRLLKIFNKCERVLCEMKLDPVRLASDYKDIPLVYRQLHNVRGRLRRKEEVNYCDGGRVSSPL